MTRIEPMKIGVVRQRYVASGGAERYLAAAIGELVNRGHDVHVFANSWSVEESPKFTFHRVPIVRGTSFLRVLTFAIWSEKVVRHANCDIVFSLERTLTQDVYRAGDGCHREWLAQRKRYISAARQASLRLNPLHATLLGLERRTFSPDRTGGIIANSQRGKDEIVRHYGFPENRIEVIYNGVDLERFKPNTGRELKEDCTLLFVGTGFERKGLEYCIRVLDKLPDNYRLRVIGKGDLAAYRRLAEEIGVASRVEFAGTNLDVAQEYRNAHLLVHPAIYEPFANVCLEAMASGLPVVTSRINGASEIIRPAANGAVIEQPDDIGALAAAITTFSDPAVRQRAGMEARNIAGRFPISANVDRTLEVLFLARNRKLSEPARK